jgi:hypothetical protein
MIFGFVFPETAVAPVESCPTCQSVIEPVIDIPVISISKPDTFETIIYAVILIIIIEELL